MTSPLDPYTGLMRLNTPLVEQLARQGPSVVDPLYQLLLTSPHRTQVAEGLYLAQRLAESKTSNVRKLYAAAARFNTTTDPLIQVYLAGFYRKLGVPESFGPMLAMLMRNSQQAVSSYVPNATQANEEVGGTLLQLLAEKTAEVMRTGSKQV